VSDSLQDELNHRLAEAVAAAEAACERAANAEQLEEAKTASLGRKGNVTALLREIPSLPAERRGAFGKAANQAKQRLEGVFETRRRTFASEQLREAADFDPTTPGLRSARGHHHPVLQIRREIEDIFLSMGFRVLDGPEVETEYFNFEALNIPEHHPARDLQDTIWVNDDGGGARRVLRTHTSPMQVRAMQEHGAPLRVIVPGRVYRYETLDATHEGSFHQVEGLMVDEGISVGHLKGVMQAFLGAVFARDVDVRLRPSYFPFVEPGFELDFRCVFCGGDGCSVCKRQGWIEMLGCGMVHEHVLRSGGVDPERFTGFAFGIGIDRLTMMRHSIEDIRHFHSGDLRFFGQF